MKPLNKQNNDSVWYALGLAWGLGYRIAVPLVVFALAGRWIDRQWETSPLFLLTGVVLAVVTTSISIYKMVQEILKESLK